MTELHATFNLERRINPRIETAPLVRAVLIGLALLGACLALAIMAPINGAVVAPGQVLVEGKPQPVQSLEPGIVTTVAVRNGDRVEAGALLLALDPALLQTRLDNARDRLAAALAEEARLTAEADGLDQPSLAVRPLPFAAPDLSQAIRRQKVLFDIRQAQRREARSRLAATDAQLQAQADGLVAQISAAEDEARMLREDLERQGDLVAKGLANRTLLRDIQRQEAVLEGRIAGLRAEGLRVESARREAVLALAQDESRRDEDIAQTLRDLGTTIQDLTAEILSLRNSLARTELRAPTAGMVHDLQVTAPGSVVSAGGVLVQIVPIDRAMEIEVTVDPKDIDHVRSGQAAQIMLLGSDPRAVPKLEATVTHVPPGAVRDPQTGRSIYRVMLTLDAGQLPGDIALRSGMPVQAFLTTGERRLLSWLLSPLMVPMSQALRER